MSNPSQPHLALICHVQYTPADYDRILQGHASSEQQLCLFGVNLAIAVVDPNSVLDARKLAALTKDDRPFKYLVPWRWQAPLSCTDWLAADAQIYEVLAEDAHHNRFIDFGKTVACHHYNAIESDAINPLHQLGYPLECDALATWQDVLDMDVQRRIKQNGLLWNPGQPPRERDVNRVYVRDLQGQLSTFPHPIGPALKLARSFRIPAKDLAADESGEKQKILFLAPRIQSNGSTVYRPDPRGPQAVKPAATRNVDMFRWQYVKTEGNDPLLVTIADCRLPVFAYLYGVPYNAATLFPSRKPAATTTNGSRRAAGEVPVLNPQASLWVAQKTSGWFTHDWVSEMQPRLASGFDLAQRLIDWFRQQVAQLEKQPKADPDKKLPDWRQLVVGLRHAVFLALRDTSGPGVMIPPTGNSLVDFCIEDWKPRPTPPTGAQPAVPDHDPQSVANRVRFAAGSRSFRDAAQRSHRWATLDDWRNDVRTALPNLKESPILKGFDADIRKLPNSTVVDQLDSLQSALAADDQLASVVIQEWKTAIRRNAEFSFPCPSDDDAKKLCQAANTPCEKTTVHFFRRFGFDTSHGRSRTVIEPGELNADCEDEWLLTFPQIDQSLWKDFDDLDLYRITLRDGRWRDETNPSPELEITAHVKNKEFVFHLLVAGKTVHSFRTLQCRPFSLRISRRDEAGVNGARVSWYFPSPEDNVVHELGPKALQTLEEAWVTFELYPCAWSRVDGNIDRAQVVTPPVFLSSRSGNDRLDATQFQKLLKDRGFDDDALAYGHMDQRWLNLAEQFWSEFVGDDAARKSLTQNAKVRTYQLNSVLGAPWPLILDVTDKQSLIDTTSAQLQAYFRQRLTETEKPRQFAAFYPQEKNIWGPHEDADAWDKQEWLFCKIDGHLRAFTADLVSQGVQPDQVNGGAAASPGNSQLPQQITEASRPIAHSLAIPFDRMGGLVSDDAQKSIYDGETDYLRHMAGVGLLLKACDGKGDAKPYRCLNVVKVRICFPEVELPPITLHRGMLVPYRLNYVNGQRSTIVSYDNRPIIAPDEMTRLSEYEGQSTRTTKPLYQLVYELVDGSIEKDLDWSRLPMLIFGRNYNLCAFWMSNALHLPPELADRHPAELGSVQRFNTAAEDLADWGFVRTLKYLRMVRVGAVHFASTKRLQANVAAAETAQATQDALPTLPADCHPLSRQLRTVVPIPRVCTHDYWPNDRSRWHLRHSDAAHDNEPISFTIRLAGLWFRSLTRPIAVRLQRLGPGGKTLLEIQLQHAQQAGEPNVWQVLVEGTSIAPRTVLLQERPLYDIVVEYHRSDKDHLWLKFVDPDGRGNSEQILWKIPVPTKPIKAQVVPGSAGAAAGTSQTLLDLAFEVQVVADPLQGSESWNDILSYQSPELTVEPSILVETLDVQTQAQDPRKMLEEQLDDGLFRSDETPVLLLAPATGSKRPGRTNWISGRDQFSFALRKPSSNLETWLRWPHFCFDPQSADAHALREAVWCDVLRLRDKSVDCSPVDQQQETVLDPDDPAVEDALLVQLVPVFLRETPPGFEEESSVQWRARLTRRVPLKTANPHAPGVKRTQAGPLVVEVKQLDPFVKRNDLLEVTQDAERDPTVTINVIDGEIWELWVWAPVCEKHWKDQPKPIFDHSVIEFGRPFLDSKANSRKMLFAPFRLKIEAAIDIREERVLFVTTPGSMRAAAPESPEKADELARGWIDDCGYQVHRYELSESGYSDAAIDEIERCHEEPLAKVYRRRLYGAHLVVFSSQAKTLDSVIFRAWNQALRSSNVPVLIASALPELISNDPQALLPLVLDSTPYKSIQVVRNDISAGLPLGGRSLQILPPPSPGQQPPKPPDTTAKLATNFTVTHQPFAIADAVVSPAPTSGIRAVVVGAGPSTQDGSGHEKPFSSRRVAFLLPLQSLKGGTDGVEDFGLIAERLFKAAIRWLTGGRLCDNLWDATDPAFEAAPVSQVGQPGAEAAGDHRINVRFNREISRKFVYISDVDLLRQSWRWNGLAVSDFPFRYRSHPDEMARLRTSLTSREIDLDQVSPDASMCPLFWDAQAFGTRSEDDHLRVHISIPLHEPHKLLHSEALVKDTRARYERYSLVGYSRYRGLAIQSGILALRHPDPAMLSPSTDTDRWKRLVVPCRWKTCNDVARPFVQFVLPLTEPVIPSPPEKGVCNPCEPSDAQTLAVDAAWSATPGLLVMVGDLWFDKYGLAEVLEADVEWKADPQKVLWPEAGPDPILDGRSFDNPPSTRFDLKGPYGTTFDTKSDEPEYFRSWFVLHPQIVEEAKHSLGWYFFKVQFRRLLEPEAFKEALPLLPQYLPEETPSDEQQNAVGHGWVFDIYGQQWPDPDEGPARFCFDMPSTKAGSLFEFTVCASQTGRGEALLNVRGESLISSIASLHELKPLPGLWRLENDAKTFDLRIRMQRDRVGKKDPQDDRKDQRFDMWTVRLLFRTDSAQWIPVVEARWYSRPASNEPGSSADIQQPTIRRKVSAGWKAIPPCRFGMLPQSRFTDPMWIQVLPSYQEFNFCPETSHSKRQHKSIRFDQLRLQPIRLESDLEGFRIAQPATKDPVEFNGFQLVDEEHPDLPGVLGSGLPNEPVEWHDDLVNPCSKSRFDAWIALTRVIGDVGARKRERLIGVFRKFRALSPTGARWVYAPMALSKTNPVSREDLLQYSRFNDSMEIRARILAIQFRGITPADLDQETELDLCWTDLFRTSDPKRQDEDEVARIVTVSAPFGLVDLFDAPCQARSPLPVSRYLSHL